MLSFRKITVAKKFMDKRCGEVSRFSVESFSSDSAEKFRRGPLSGVTNLGYRKKFMLQRVMSPSSVEIFLTHSAENFRRRTLMCCLSETLR